MPAKVVPMPTNAYAPGFAVTPGPNGKNPELESRGADGSTNLSAETITAQFAAEGWLTRIEGAGDVRGSRRTGKEVDDFRAEHGAMELWPKVNQPRELNLKGGVQLKTQADKSSETRMLQTSELLMEFGEGKKGEGNKARAKRGGQKKKQILRPSANDDKGKNAGAARVDGGGGFAGRTHASRWSRDEWGTGGCHRKLLPGC